MKAQKKLQELSESIVNRKFPDDKPYRSKKILWIIKKFIEYTMLAALNGYVIKVPYLSWISLRIDYIQFVPWRLKRKLIFSPKAFGYTFTMMMSKGPLARFGYKFSPDIKWRRRIEEIIDTDVVYSLIKGT